MRGYRGERRRVAAGRGGMIPLTGKATPGSDSGEATQVLLADLARRYGASLRRFFQRRSPGLGADADDLAQDVFLRLAQRGGLADIARIETYMFQTAANVLRDRARRRIVRRGEAALAPQHLLHTADLEDFSPERVCCGREQVALVAAALHELPERTRAIFLLHRFEDLTYPDIAGRFEISVSAVEKHMMRALVHVGAAVGRGR